MKERIYKTILIIAVAWITFFALPGPGQFINWFNKFPRHPDYVFADHHRQVCQRLRLIKNAREKKLYVENLSHHGLHIVLDQRQLRALIYLCNLTKENKHDKVFFNSLD